MTAYLWQPDAAYFQINSYRKICIYSNIDKGGAYFFRKTNHSLFKKIGNRVTFQRELSLRLYSVMKANQLKKDFSVNFQWREGNCVCVRCWTPLSFPVFCRAVRSGSHHLLPISYVNLLPDADADAHEYIFECCFSFALAVILGPWGGEDLGKWHEQSLLSAC